MQNKTSKKIIMGKFGSVYGIHGWIRVNSYTDPPTNLFNYDLWQVAHQGQWQTITIQQVKQHGAQYIVKLPDCDNRELAQRYTNDLIAINRDQLPELEAETYYWTDLIGLQVINTTGYDLGQVKEVINTGANDIFIVENDKRRLIPHTEDVVKSINLKDNILTVDWDPNF